jgi:hypothetical protein
MPAARPSLIEQEETMPTGSARTGTARLYLHLVIYTAADLAAGARRVWRGQDRVPRVDRTLRQKLAVLGRFLAYHLRTAFDPREFFAVDGDFAGRRRGQLDRAGRRQRRRLRDLPPPRPGAAGRPRRQPAGGRGEPDPALADRLLSAVLDDDE